MAGGLARVPARSAAAALAFALPAALLFAGHPARATTSENRGAAWLAASEPCRAARRDSQKPPAEQLATCEQVLAALEAKHADPAQAPQNDTEENFYWFAVFTARSGMSGAMADIDQVRSQRVCEQVFVQEKLFAKMKDEAWPPGYLESILKLRESALAPTAKCHSEWG